MKDLKQKIHSIILEGLIYQEMGAYVNPEMISSSIFNLLDKELKDHNEKSESLIEENNFQKSLIIKLMKNLTMLIESSITDNHLEWMKNELQTLIDQTNSKISKNISETIGFKADDPFKRIFGISSTKESERNRNHFLVERGIVAGISHKRIIDSKNLMINFKSSDE